MDNQIVYYIVVSAILFFILNGLSQNTLLVIVIIVIVIIYLYNIDNNKGNKDKRGIDLNNIFEDTKGHPLETTNYIIEKNTKDFKYLIKDDDLMNIVKMMRFTKRYDKARYSDLLNQLNTYMKYYIFMLKDRYDIPHFLPLMHDMYMTIIENMYSFYLVLPTKMAHVYGFKPLDRLHECITTFRKRGKIMIDTVKKHGKNNVHLLDTDIEPYNSRDNLMLP